MIAGDAVSWARAAGARPALFLGLFVVAAVCMLAALLVAVRWSEARAPLVWARAMRVFRGVTERPAARALEARWPFLWRVARTLTAAEYLVVHLAIGLCVALCALTFLWLAAEVRGGEEVVAVDVALANALHDAGTPSGVAVARVYTSLGGGWALTALGVVVTVVLALNRQRLLAIGWAVAMSGVGLLNRALKGAFSRPRPVFPDAYAVEQGWSFPSGHSMGTLVAAGMLAYLGVLFARTHGRRVAIVLGAWCWTVAMGYSRMYLGVHFLSDVIAGFAAGTVWLGACITGIEIARRKPQPAGAGG